MKGKSSKYVLLLPVVELLGVMLPLERIHWLVTYAQIEGIIICLCGYFGIKKDLWLFLSIYFFWILVTNNLPVIVPQELALIEVGIFSCIIFWLHQRPERIPSDPPSKTVQIAFYYGEKFPFVAKLFSFIGLPVNGIGIIIDNDGIFVRGRTGKMEKRSRELFRRWIILDTKVPVNKDIIQNFHALEGQAASKSGCMIIITTFLSRLGAEYTPSSLLQSPSSYMSQILSVRDDK